MTDPDPGERLNFSENPQKYHLDVDISVNIDPVDATSNIQQAALCLAQTISPAHTTGKPWQSVIRLADTPEVQALNAQYRHKNKPTNVLSFPQKQEDSLSHAEGDYFYIGDIIMAWPIVMEEAGQAELCVEDHLKHLAIHGILHLFGFDHEEESAAYIMEDLEIRILSQIGIQNPYQQAGAA